MNKKSKIFTSKADILKLLNNKIKKSKIEKLFVFTVEEWHIDRKNILQKIKNIFKNDFVVVRSSALDEDSISESAAGNYESILFVKSTSEKQVTNAIYSVIDSYKLKGSFNKNNQILIQKQTLDAKLNGVIFTRTPKLGSPYYIINYNENKNTESVTKGENSNVIKIFKGIDFKKIEKRWQKILLAIKELEQILNDNTLDIEFAITKNEIIIFQVRPLTIVNSSNQIKDRESFGKIILENKSKFEKLSKSKNRTLNYTYFSDMSDWNPAEIIGNSPNLLDYSLYNHIIMNDAWSKGRDKIGYQKILKYPLMRKFGNKPYVDVQASFESLIPDNFQKKTRKKLLKFYLTKFKSHPYLHDKVEFDILFTCYDYNVEKRLKELSKFDFNIDEILEIKNNLIEFTNNVIKKFPELKEDTDSSLNKMKKRREEIIKKLNSKKISNCERIDCVNELLKDCKKYGAIPFSSIARIAFIANILLKSLEKEGKITIGFVNKFMSSIKTPLSDFQDDLMLLKSNKISKKIFLKKYGHLRPGTYDITALPYDKQFSILHKSGMIKGKIEKRDIDKFPKKINLSPLKFKEISFLRFVREALIEREKLKFEFTKNLSISIETIAKIGNNLDFTREEISNLDIKFILNSSKYSKKNMKGKWKKKIEKEKETKKIMNGLVLPSIIFSKKDLEIIKYHSIKPNFITTKKISSKIIRLSNNDRKIPHIDGKIILIENADPGYDWIFSKKPKALITKYGGVASHMAIRCAEISLPAAIGCGEILFEQLENSKKILLDCLNEQIISVEDSKTNEMMEVKRTLKTLGYIK